MVFVGNVCDAAIIRNNKSNGKYFFFIKRKNLLPWPFFVSKALATTTVGWSWYVTDVYATIHIMPHTYYAPERCRLTNCIGILLQFV